MSSSCSVLDCIQVSGCVNMGRAPPITASICAVELCAYTHFFLLCLMSCVVYSMLSFSQNCCQRSLCGSSGWHFRLTGLGKSGNNLCITSSCVPFKSSSAASHANCVNTRVPSCVFSSASSSPNSLYLSFWCIIFLPWRLGVSSVNL